MMVVFGYSEVEEALAKVLEIKPPDRSAFAARLRHLRNLGLPKAKPGSGKRVSYSLPEAEQMLIALLLERVGCSPRTAVRTVESLQRQRGTRMKSLLALSAEKEARLLEENEVQNWMRHEAVAALVNLSLAGAKLKNALAAD